MKVKFVPQNIECEIKPGQSVMHVAQDNGLYVKSVCKGVPSCAECRVRVVDGEHHVLPPGTEELSLIGTGHFIDNRRLSCQLKCFGDITVDMTEQTQKQAGLIGGRKSKQKLIKDDRVEDAVAIRLNDDSRGPGDEESSAQSRPSKPNEPRKPRPPREHQARPQGSDRGPRDKKEQRSPDPTAPGYSAIDAAAPDAKGGRGPRRKRRRGGRGGGGGGGGPKPTAPNSRPQ